MIRSYSLAFCFFGLVVGCGQVDLPKPDSASNSDRTNETEKSENQKSEKKSAESPKNSTDQASGNSTDKELSISGLKYIQLPTGEMVFEQPLGQVLSGANVTFELALLNNGQATLCIYCDSAAKNGIAIVIRRNGSKFQIEIDQKIFDLKIPMSPDGTLGLTFDFHNQENPGHLLVWDLGSTVFNPKSSIIDSEFDLAETWENGKQGKGTFLSFKLQQATLNKLQMSTVRYAH